MVRIASAGAVESVQIRNLGLGGACFELAEASVASGHDAAFEPNAPVVIEVIAPTLWDPLALRGAIAWVRRQGPGKPTRAGVRFEHHEAPALYALFQLIGGHAYES